MRVGRNLAGAAMRVATHQSVMLIPWAVAGVGEFVLLSAWLEGIDAVSMRTACGMDKEFFVALVLAGMNVLPAWWYFRAIWRGTSATRFANR